MKKICKTCGNRYVLNKSYSNKQKEQSKFCSIKCKNLFRSINGTGIVTCILCGKKFRTTKYNIARGRKYCTRECCSEHQKVLMSGEGNHFFGKSHDEETKKRISEAKIGVPNLKKRGENSNFWRGGVSQRNRRLRNCIMKTPEYIAWRKAVLRRDNHTCQECGEPATIVHHIISYGAMEQYIRNKYGGKNIKGNLLKLELLWDINNGASLCDICHRKTDTYSRKN